MQHTRPNPEMQQGSRLIFCGIKYVAIQNVGLGLIQKERKKKLVSKGLRLAQSVVAW